MMQLKKRPEACSSSLNQSQTRAAPTADIPFWATREILALLKNLPNERRGLETRARRQRYCCLEDTRDIDSRDLETDAQLLKKTHSYGTQIAKIRNDRVVGRTWCQVISLAEHMYGIHVHRSGADINFQPDAHWLVVSDNSSERIKFVLLVLSTEYGYGGLWAQPIELLGAWRLLFNVLTSSLPQQWLHFQFWSHWSVSDTFSSFHCPLTANWSGF